MLASTLLTTPKSLEVHSIPRSTDAKAGCLLLSASVGVPNRFSSAHVSRGVETLRELETVKHDRQAPLGLTLGQNITDLLD